MKLFAKKANKAGNRPSEKAQERAVSRAWVELVKAFRVDLLHPTQRRLAAHLILRNR